MIYGETLELTISERLLLNILQTEGFMIVPEQLESSDEREVACPLPKSWKKDIKIMKVRF